jgi:hypothetical protein
LRFSIEVNARDARQLLQIENRQSKFNNSAAQPRSRACSSVG